MSHHLIFHFLPLFACLVFPLPSLLCLVQSLLTSSEEELTVVVCDGDRGNALSRDQRETSRCAVD